MLAAAATTGGAPNPSFAADPKPLIDPDSLQNMQDHKLAFLNGPTDRRTVSSDRLMNPASSYVLQAGTVIPAALITGIQSDLPGLITAQVTENVYDSPTGRFLLVPQGAKLIGSYDSQVSFGQSRVLLVWNRIVFPNGQSIVLEHQPGADTEGYAGLEDGVDYHWGNLLKTAALSTLLGVGAELGSNGNQSDLVRALQRGSQDFDQSVRPATRSPPDQCPADPHHPAGLPGPGPRQSRSRARAISGIRTTMTKLKLSAVPDDRPVKFTIDLPAAVHRDLALYAELLAKETSQAAVEPAKLIPPMIARFMASDRAFAKAKRAKN